MILLFIYLSHTNVQSDAVIRLYALYICTDLEYSESLYLLKKVFDLLRKYKLLLKKKNEKERQ